MSDAPTVNGFIRAGDSKGSIALNTEQTAPRRRLSGPTKPCVFTLVGSPYPLRAVPELPGCVLTYETHRAAELAAPRAIAGELEFRRRLPVSLPGFHDLGHRAGP